MPSPFPGMDPFVEAHYFGALHSGMITYLQEGLQKQLPANYFALSGERVWIDATSRWIEPDVHVEKSAKKSRKSATSAATIARKARPVIVRVPHDERREPYLEIYEKRDATKRLVCTIEILSLTNKTPGEKGQELYRQKQSEILESNTHLIEIDLLRAGIHTTAVALDRALAETGKFDYHVCVRRFNRFEDFEVYPILMQQSLPSVAVPLMPGDSDVEVDLQAVFERTYDAGPFARAIDYRTDPVEPPLTPEQEKWMRDILRGTGMPRKQRA